MGQWDGRLLREEPVELPETIDEAEMLAVAAVHFPGFDEDYLRVIIARVSSVRGSSVYAQIAKVCKMTFAIARENGRQRPVLADIKEASAEVLPSYPEILDPAAALPKPAPRRSVTPLPSRPPRRGNLASATTLQNEPVSAG